MSDKPEKDEKPDDDAKAKARARRRKAWALHAASVMAAQSSGS